MKIQSWPNVHEARRILWGKNHYFDVGTMRFFRSRYADGALYNSERVDDFGRAVQRVLVARESVQGPGMAREYRVVVIRMLRDTCGVTRVPATRSTSHRIYHDTCARVADGTFHYNGEG